MASLRAIDKVADLFDRLRLDYKVRSEGAFVVEGPTDARVLAQALGLDRRQFFAVSGRNNVLRFADTVRASSLPGVVCIADRDFDDEARDRATQAQLIFTDNCDVDSMLVLSDAFPRVLEEWATAGRLNRWGGSAGIRDWALSVVGPVSALRRANAVLGLGLVFDEVDLADVIDRRTLELRFVGWLDRVSRASGMTRPELEAVIESTPEPECPVTARPLARGRDVGRALEVALTGAIGSLQRQQAQGLVDRSLRLAVRPPDFDSLSFPERLVATRRAGSSGV